MNQTKRITTARVVGGEYWLAGLALILSSFFLFIRLSMELLDHKLLAFDQVITGYISLLNNPVMTQVMKVVTFMGSAATLIFLAVIIVFYFAKSSQYADAAKMVIVALAGSWLMNELLKWIFQRNRPPEIARLIDVSGYSFPSGHAMVSFAFYGLLIYFLWVNTSTEKWKYVWTGALIFLVLAIGVSRIYLGVHYPSDVIAGFAAGGAWLTGCILELQSIRFHTSEKGELTAGK